LQVPRLGLTAVMRGMGGAPDLLLAAQPSHAAPDADAESGSPCVPPGATLSDPLP